MTKRFSNFFTISLLVCLHVIISFFALSQPYHHDEYKWALIADYKNGLAGTIPHPPLSEFLYHATGFLTGYDNLRILPFVISIGALILLFYIVDKFYDRVTAILAGLIFSIIPYSVIASVQIDIDGAMLPFWSLLMILGYTRLREKGYGDNKAIAIIALSLIAGMFSKLSFILMPAIIVCHLVYEKWNGTYVREKIKTIFTRKVVIGIFVFATAILFGAKFFSDIYFFRYVKNFTHLADRDFFQLFFLSAKAAIYLSPLLILGFFLGLKRFKELSLWYFWIAASIFFYAVVFDFTHRTLDRYWMILIIPLIVITSVVVSRFVQSVKLKDSGMFLLAVVLIGLCGLWIASLPHRILPLTPKEEFINAFVSFDWNILIPLTGGSGPLGFYTSLLFVAVFGFFGILTALGMIFGKEKLQKISSLIFLSSLFCYSGIMLTEYFTGYFYGSPAKILTRLIVYTATHDTGKILTYNDIGAYELTGIGKYQQRFYIHDAFVEANKPRLLSFSGNYLVLNFPEINKKSLYYKYFNTCRKAYEASDGYVSGFIFDCSQGDKNILR